MRKYITFTMLSVLSSSPWHSASTWAFCHPGVMLMLPWTRERSLCSLYWLNLLKSPWSSAALPQWAGNCSQSGARTRLNSQRALKSHQSKQGWITSSAKRRGFELKQNKQANKPPHFYSKAIWAEHLHLRALKILPKCTRGSRNLSPAWAAQFK